MEQNHIKTIIKTIIQKEGIANPKVEYEKTERKGEGFIGIVDTIEINGTNKSLHLIMKSASPNEKFRKCIPVREAFLNEIEFYDEIIPEFYKLQKDCNITNGFNKVANCYATFREPLQEVVIMENLKSLGYEMWDRKKEMNLEHVTYVLEQYGRYHANSYALKNKRSDVFEKFAYTRHDFVRQLIKNGFKSTKNIIHRVATSFDKSSEADCLDAFKKFVDNLWDAWNSVLVVDEYAVITHGDCWCNNMMFQYESEDHTVPKNMRFIDFQLTMHVSPICDLSYFFYANAPEEALNNLGHFQKVYYDSLSKHLREFGCDPNTILPFDAYLNQWKKYAGYGLILSSVAMKAMTSDPDEVPDLQESSEEGDADMIKAFDYISRNDAEFMRRMRNVYRHFYENGFLSGV